MIDRLTPRGDGSAVWLRSIAAADAALAGSYRDMDRFIDRFGRVLGPEAVHELDRIVGFLHHDRWAGCATRVIAALFDEIGEQPATIHRDPPGRAAPSPSPIGRLPAAATLPALAIRGQRALAAVALAAVLGCACGCVGAIVLIGRPRR